MKIGTCITLSRSGDEEIDFYGLEFITTVLFGKFYFSVVCENRFLLNAERASSGFIACKLAWLALLLYEFTLMYPEF